MTDDKGNLIDYACNECVDLYYSFEGRCEDECEITHCTNCVSEHHCISCDDGFVPYFDICKPSTAIPGCKTLNSTDNRLCEICEIGWSLNWDKTGCIDCSAHSPGCTECESTRVAHSKDFFQCTDCALNFVFNDGECSFDTCYEWYLRPHTLSQKLKGYCSICADGYGFDKVEDVDGVIIPFE